MRHDGVDIDRAHAFADRPLHTQQADPVLVFHKLANRADAPVTQVIDIVDLATPILQLNENPDNLQDVLAAQHTNRVLGLKAETGIHLHPADSGQVIALRIEEQALEQCLCGILGWWLAGPHDPIDIDQRFFP